MTTRIPTRTGPQRCLCCHTPYADGYIRARTCACQWPLCTCGKCQVHCRCSALANSHAMKNSEKGFTFVTIRDMILEYPSKGGTYDRNGRVTDRRGGSTETENAPRPHQATAARWTDARLQDRGIMESEAERAGSVDRGPKEQSNEELISVSSVASTCGLLSFSGSQATSGCIRYLFAILRRLAIGVKEMAEVAGKGLSMNRIHLFDMTGQEVGHISESTLSALIDSGLLNRECTPAATLATSTHLCIHSTCMQPASVGAFCASCFEHLRVFERAFAEAWYREWPEALACAERMVSA